MAKAKTSPESPKQTTMLDSGAPAALRALEAQELADRKAKDAAWLALQQAYANKASKPAALDGADFDKEIAAADMQYASARAYWLSSIKQLLPYDKGISENKRDAGEKITRAECEKIFQMFAIYDRTASESFITSLCGNVLTCKTREEVYAKYAEEYRNCKRIALESALRENHLPAWVSLVLESEL